MQISSYHIVLFLSILAGLILTSSDMKAQLYGNNLFEYQLGNIPDIEPSDETTHYDQLNLYYRYKKIKIFIRHEHFLSSEEDRRYAKLSQYRLDYKNKGFDLKVGHFNDMLGNGLLFRTYEIPSSVFEEQGYRIRYGFYRDIKGFSAGYRHKYFYIKGLRGNPLINQLPPILEEEYRRVDLVEAVEGGVNLFDQSLGLIYLRNNLNHQTEHYNSWLLSGNLPFNLFYKAEFAQKINTQQWINIQSDTSAYALYISLNWTINKLGVSLEWKDYQNFFLGSGFNDPPTLVKEHPFKLLNRNTHLPELINEKGYQAEVYYMFENGTMATFNTAWARNELWKDLDFFEYYIDVNAPVQNIFSFILFADYADSDIEFKKDIVTAGVYAESNIYDNWSGEISLEGQQFTRNLMHNEQIYNLYSDISVTYQHKYTAGFIFEATTDPFLTDRINTTEVETATRFYSGINLSYKPNSSNTMQLFAGERRGGPACTSGICYEVLDFRGIEFRLITRF